jgi:hypothetical protein
LRLWRARLSSFFFLCLRIFLRRFLITLPTETALLASWRWIERRDQYCLAALPSSVGQKA